MRKYLFTMVMAGMMMMGINSGAWAGANDRSIGKNVEAAAEFFVPNEYSDEFGVTSVRQQDMYYGFVYGNQADEEKAQEYVNALLDTGLYELRGTDGWNYGHEWFLVYTGTQSPYYIQPTSCEDGPYHVNVCTFFEDTIVFFPMNLRPECFDEYAGLYGLGAAGSTADPDEHSTCSSCFGSGEQNCMTCGGSGTYYWSGGEVKDCHHCHGSGKIECFACDGRG